MPIYWGIKKNRGRNLAEVVGKIEEGKNDVEKVWNETRLAFIHIIPV